MPYPRTNNFVMINGKPKGEYFIDDSSWVSNLPSLDVVAAGSDAYDTSTQNVYILNAQGKWRLQ